MKEIKINLLSPSSLSEYPVQNQQKPAKKHLSKALIMVLALTFVLTATSVFSYQRSKDEDSRLNKTVELFSGIGQLVTNGNRALQGEQQDRINILLMGIGGEGHEGGELTDTIIIASIKPSTHQVAFVSVPRDLLVNIDGYGWRKINNANAFGELAMPGSGPELAKKTVSEMLNQPIHYYVKVDFDAFKEMVDILGGIDVVVDNSFTDYQYPTLNKKYQVVSFEKGLQTMNGDAALKFVRSRHSIMNNEGSDFARSKRQQKAIIAMRDKMLSAGFLLNPKKISEILESLQTHLKTNMEIWEMVRFASLAKELDTKNINRLTLDDGPGGYLQSTMVEGAYVLQPREGNFTSIQEAFNHILDGQVVVDEVNQPRLAAVPQDNPSKMPTTTQESIKAPAKAKVVVKNGTLIEGFAARASQRLSYNNYEVTSIGNAKERDLLKSIIYNLSGSHMVEIKEIADQFNAEIKTTPYEDSSDEALTGADILLILGDTTNH